MNLDTSFFDRHITSLEKAFQLLQETDTQDLNYDLYRSASVKEFEIILEQSGKLLKKCLKPYFGNPKEVERLIFKDVFRHASVHSLISLEEAER